MKHICVNIKHYRDLRQYSQEYMASRLNINQSSYAKLENQEIKLTVQRLQQIAEVLEVDLNLLLNSKTPITFNLYDNQKANDRAVYEYNNLPEQLLNQYQAQIQQLKEEVAFLRVWWEKKMR